MKVELTAHAQERLEQRFTRMGVRGAVSEIVRAIEQGRVSDIPPCQYLARRGGCEYAWTPRRERIYVLQNRTMSWVTLVTCMIGPGDTRP